MTEQNVGGAVEGTRVVTVHNDTDHEGETIKAGTQVLPAHVADALIEDDRAYEPGGKKRGR